MNVLIIDDEKPARDEMRLLLSAHAALTIVGEATTVESAIDAISSLKPDVVFLDINLRGRSGFEVLDTLPLPHPVVVFCTAYDEHAVRAFDVNALDYLVKPVNPDRLAQAVTKILDCIRPADSEFGIEAFHLESRVFVRDGERCWFVAVKDIEWIEANGNYSRVYFYEERPLLYRSLSALEERLPAGLFIRANRSQLINTRFIAELKPWFSQTLKATLKSGVEIEFSRRATLLFRERSSL
ncbi:MAG: hypothetical protein RL693_2301 [Verrucomicrobiota bacterium]|jgi:two-component system LytT family response regulator